MARCFPVTRGPLRGQGVLFGTSSFSAAPLPKSATAAAHRPASQSIETIRVGQRVVAHNPDPDSCVRTADLKVDSATWRFLRLRAEDRWPDGTLDVVEVETLQPAEWVASKKAAVGATVPLPLDLLEMGLPETLQARVVANEPCPPIASGSGAVVLTTVNHLNPNVFELTLSDDHGKRETIRPTGLHKFFSGDRRCWVNTQEVKEGKQLRSIDGWLTASSLRRLAGRAAGLQHDRGRRARLPRLHAGSAVPQQRSMWGRNLQIPSSTFRKAVRWPDRRLPCSYPAAH